MRYDDVVSNVCIYGLEDSVRSGGAAADPLKITTEIAEAGSPAKLNGGHDVFLNGIIVQFDLTFTSKAWVAAERYHFLNFVSPQSSMLQVTDSDPDQAYIEYVDGRIAEIMKEKIREYNDLQNEIRTLRAQGKDVTTLMDLSNQKYLEIIYSNPSGFRMTARMTTNYRQLRTIYRQRKSHRLPEWRAFCAWCETLPHAEFITGNE
ncbi:MAG: hypothetical protein K6D03_03865 [Solobacterium sp.]|nr:hypothetical protein [Solobacterium sp.]